MRELDIFDHKRVSDGFALLPVITFLAPIALNLPAYSLGKKKKGEDITASSLWLPSTGSINIAAGAIAQKY